jgi:predicted signal transduction protein with EAL and GGDEF domain
VARLSGDEFVIFCEDLDSTVQVDMIAARLAAAIAAPFDLAGTEVDVSASVGIAYSSGQTAEQLLDDADTAMYQAKRKGGDRYQVIDIAAREQSMRRATLLHDLRGAAVRQELRTDYQPILDAGAGGIAAVEGLVRWVHPVRGLVMPDVLLPIAEASGLIGEIGGWVLERACRDLHRWQAARPDDELRMSVNVSAHELLSPDYAAMVSGVLSGTGTDPGLVTLEIKEAVLQDRKLVLGVLEDLKSIGVTLALDGFGTGCSSLNSLVRFPIDIVKLDRQLISGVAHDPDTRAVVFAVIELAHILRMAVVAEGVETLEQRRELDALHCDSYQGYLFARPMSADDLTVWLAGPLQPAGVGV